MGRRGKNLIPDGWQGCPSMGTGFVDDRFFVFKTPLKQDLNSKVPPSDRFAIENVFQCIKQMNHSNIGLWIDLTNTSRYYNPDQIQNRGIQYEKLSCEGHGKPPSQRTIYTFCNLVHNFFKRNRRDYVGVHCTHGFNRTGYLICCYLIRYRRYTAAEAVQEFSRVRQPGIYRQMYINDLYTMSSPLQTPIQVSEPDWVVPKQRQQPLEQATSSKNNQLHPYGVGSSTMFSQEAIGNSDGSQMMQPHLIALLPTSTSAINYISESLPAPASKPVPILEESSSSSF